jgi:hypothetical protein
MMDVDKRQCRHPLIVRALDQMGTAALVGQWRIAAIAIDPDNSW